MAATIVDSLILVHSMSGMLSAHLFVSAIVFNKGANRVAKGGNAQFALLDASKEASRAILVLRDSDRGEEAGIKLIVN